MAKSLILSSGEEVLLDDSDYAWLSRWSWGKNSSGYARRTRTEKNNPSGYATVLMHRLILCVPPGLEVDHINRNKLDNRRENLRCSTRVENFANRPPTSLAGFKGVEFNKKLKTRPWSARITVRKSRIHLGMFGTAEEAARAYDAAAVETYGQFAEPNFPTGCGQ